MISLPWPPAALSPNARVHYHTKATAARKYKSDCHKLLSQHRAELMGLSSFAIVFHPPSRRGNDLDNCLSSSKAAIDALSLVSGVDDRNFALSIVKGEPVKHGSVTIAWVTA